MAPVSSNKQVSDIIFIQEKKNKKKMYQKKKRSNDCNGESCYVHPTTSDKIHDLFQSG